MATSTALNEAPSSQGFADNKLFKSAKQKLDDAGFPLDLLPENDANPLWKEMKTDYGLTTAEIAALQKYLHFSPKLNVTTPRSPACNPNVADEDFAHSPFGDLQGCLEDCPDVSTEAAIIGPGPCLLDLMKSESDAKKDRLKAMIGILRQQYVVSPISLASVDPDLLLAIRLYTIKDPIPLYQYFNNAFYLRSGLESAKPFARRMLRAVRALRSTSLFVSPRAAFRGLKISGNAILQQKFDNDKTCFAVGNLITMAAFTSVSTVDSVCDEFGDSLFYHIQNPCGIDISSLSAYPTENEILLAPPAVFRIVGTMKVKNVLTVTLVQVEQQSAFYCKFATYDVADLLRRGLHYYNGSASEGIAPDYVEALRYFRLAADEGYPEAHYQLAKCYKDGTGVDIDVKETVRQYQEAANRGHTAARHDLALCFESGIGVDQDFDEAIRLLRINAESGVTESQLQLELLRILSRITDSAFSAAATTTSAKDILQTIEMIGKNLHTSCLEAILQANMEPFSIMSFSNIIQLSDRLGSFADCCKLINFEVQEWTTCCCQVEEEWQRYFILKPALLISHLISAHNILELEQLLSQLRALKLRSVQCHVDANYHEFWQLLKKLMVEWRDQVDSLRDELFRRVCDLPVDRYPSNPPKLVMDVFLQCSEMHVENAASVRYRAIHDELVAAVTKNLTDMLNPNEDESSFKYSERLQSVQNALPHVTEEIVDVVQSRISEACQFALEMKLELKQQRSQILDSDRILTLLQDVIIAKDFKGALECKKMIMRSMRDCFDEHTILILQGNLLGGLELAARMLVPISRVIDIIKQCRLPLSNEIVKYPDVFSYDKLSKIMCDIRLFLSQKLNDSVRFLESITLDRLDLAPLHVTVLLKLLELRSNSWAPHLDMDWSAKVTRIRTAIENFHACLVEMVVLGKRVFEEGNMATIRALLDTAKVIDPTVVQWERFVDSSRFHNFALRGGTDLSSIRYTQLQRKLDTSIEEWSSLLKGERFFFSAVRTRNTNADRDAFYRNVNMSLQCISQLNDIVHHSVIFCSNVAEECVEHAWQQTVAISNELSQVIARIPSENDEIYIRCCSMYENLRSIAANVERGTIRKKALEATMEVNELFKRKFSELYQEIDGLTLVPGEFITKAHIDSCIDKLVQFKRMSNLLVCFSEEIDNIIDVLTTDSLQKGDYGVERFGLIAFGLVDRLERDFGEHIRSLLQHRAFDEITHILRWRRTRMFTIYHVLGYRIPSPDEAHDSLVDDNAAPRIEGDDIGPQTRINLYYHWREFDVLYWSLVRPGLKEPFQQMGRIVEIVNLTILRIPYLTEQLRFRCLLSYIFAYWTLSHYAGMGCLAKANSPARNKTENNYCNTNSKVPASRGEAECLAGNVNNDVLDLSNFSSASASARLVDFLIQPHPAQVVTLFRLLGIEGSDYDASAPVHAPVPLIRRGPLEYTRFPKHFVEIPIGEGKSVVFAVLATVMALLGYTVHCAYHFAYLSKRDQDRCRQIFNGFTVSQFIEYGTLGSLGEKMLNADGNIRTMVENMIDCKHHIHVGGSFSTRPRLLLIDEVDLFFSREYYGRLYEIVASINKPSLTRMAKWLWQKGCATGSNGAVTWEHVIASDEFKECMKEFGAHRDLAEEIVKGMLFDLTTVMSPASVKDYIVTEVNGSKMIAYKEEDGINHEIIKGYHTMFHYLKEFDAKEISEETLNRALIGRIYCGCYSYAEIPVRYDAVMGVTGTLHQLWYGPQSKLLAKYNIQRCSFIPSVYGTSKRTFNENDPRDVRIVENADYFQIIVEEIEIRMGRAPAYKRSVLVFFENAYQLLAFERSPHFAHYRQHAIVINETSPSSEKEGKIRAARTGQIVLLTRSMSRIQFVCYDEKLLHCGGVHVLQTFLSECKAEEVQIMSRTGQQGNSGSYSLLLNIEDLEKFGLSVECVLDNMRKGLYYEPLSKARDAHFRNSILPELDIGAIRIRDLVNESELFKNNLRANKFTDVKRYLIDQNRAKLPFATGVQCRIMVLMDATGSTQPIWLLAKYTLTSMFQRLNYFIRVYGNQADVAVQYVAYRNYNAPPEKLLEASAWKPLSEPASLFHFMDCVRTDYGLGGNEAVEVAFSHVLMQDQLDRVDAVILVGDMPPNTKEEVYQKRNSRPQGWMSTPFQSAVYYEDEMKRFRSDMPVHCFYLHGCAAAVYESIASKTSGTCQRLDVQSDDAANKLSDCVSMHICRALGGQQLVDLFRRTYNVPQGYIG